MASKIHVDNTVNERRLRPIYDWLDNGNNKKALQEADRVLKKHPSNQCARVLKALALLRLGKENECQIIMDKVRSEIPCEDSTLQAMSICYREIHQPDKISEVYEAASKADPNNEELLTHLFMSYVRLGDYKKQQQTALTLYKLKPKNPYYFWAVMSTVMQAIHADQKLAKGVILPLAERMVLKLVREGRMEAEQEVQLYLMILELQDKNEEILSVLSSPLASHLSYVPQRKATILLKLERFSEAANAYRELIKENIDNWAFYQNYLLAALEFQQPTECLDFLNNLINTSEKKIRAPYLARLELLERTDDKHLRYILQPVDFMHQYFSQFGEKGCVVSDLRLYLNLLTPEARSELLEKIEEDIGVKLDEFPTNVRQMQKHIHLQQLRRICGFHHPPLADRDKQEELIKRLCDLYKKGSELCPAEDRLPTDFCPADPYILLATHLLHQLWVDTNEASFLYRAISLLEHGLLTSPVNFHIKILLVRTYLEAGLVVAADHAFALLDVKHLQLDSLGHLHAPLLAPLGNLPLASTTLDHTAKFFLANYKDSADHLTFAYKYGSFIKIQEFVELRERLENSFYFAMATIDKMLLDLCCCDSAASLFSTLNNMHIQPHVESPIRWASLRDNRDLEVVRGWEPFNENEKKDLYMQEETRVCMLRLLAARNSVLRIVAASAEPSSIFLSKLSDELREIVEKFIPKALELFDTDGKRNRPCNLLVPLDAVERLREAYCSEQLRTIACLAKSLSDSHCPDFDCIQTLRTSPCLQTLPIPEQDTPVPLKNFFLRASTCSESLAIISAICIVCAVQSKPGTSQKKNKKKYKKIESDVINETNETKIWREVAVLLSEKVENLDAVLTEFEKYELHTGLDETDDVCVTIINRGQASLRQSCRSLKSRTQPLLRLLSNLKS